MAKKTEQPHPLPQLRVDVVESGEAAKRNWVRCEIDREIRFTTAGLESYFFSEWQPVAYDALLVAGAVQFCDRYKRRSRRAWGREIRLRIPVHEPGLWNSKPVSDTLNDALWFLTGDQWVVDFYQIKVSAAQPRQGLIKLAQDIEAVMPYSDGLDSRAVAGLMEQQLGQGLVRVRLGTARTESRSLARNRKPFAAVPFEVRLPLRNGEPSARSRGFKFLMISGLAAYLGGTQRVLLPESGQGALGPALIPVGQTYADYRNHPLFIMRMERLFEALLGYKLRFELPCLWQTKGETLRHFIEACDQDANDVLNTRSCWQQNRQVSVDRRARQCGICAACMLRRLSVHAAGVSEPSEAYVWERLDADTFDAGVATGFDPRKITNAMYQYAVAGTLHLDHLARLRRSKLDATAIDLHAFQLSGALGVSETDIRSRLERLLMQHEYEWESFMRSIGPKSFVTQWTEHRHANVA